MLHIITDEDNTLAGFILQPLHEIDEVNVIQFSKKKKSFFEKIIRYFEAKFFLLGQGISLSKEARKSIERISKDDSVLIFDIDYIRDLQVISKTLPPVKRKSIFLWNPLKTHDGKDWKVQRNLNVLRNIFDDVFTFDSSDAKNNSLRYAVQPFVDLNISSSEKDIDIYFIGSDKGRLKQLIEIKKRAEDEGLICHFHITPSKRINYSQEESKYLSYHEISYEENIKKAARSKCLVEIVQNNQTGPTMRSMEAAFLGCKLITNRTSAKNDIFYHYNNVLIFEDVKEMQLTSFLNSEMRDFNKEVKAAHEVRNWWKQFL